MRGYSSSETFPSYRDPVRWSVRRLQSVSFFVHASQFYVQWNSVPLSMGTCRDVCACDAAYSLHALVQGCLVCACMQQDIFVRLLELIRFWLDVIFVCITAHLSSSEKAIKIDCSVVAISIARHSHGRLSTQIVRDSGLQSRLQLIQRIKHIYTYVYIYIYICNKHICWGAILKVAASAADPS